MSHQYPSPTGPASAQRFVASRSDNSEAAEVVFNAPESGLPLLRSLQLGRGIAAMAVVACHAEQFAHQFASVPDWLSVILAKGYLGVDFFFVLSGFIIYYSNHRQTASAGWAESYTWSRLTRIFLPYWPIGIGLAAAYAVRPGLGGAIDWNWFSTLTLLPSADQPALSVAWTLQHEILFYGVMLVLLQTGRILPGCLIWLAAIGLARFVFGLEVPGLSLIDVEFLIGIAAAHHFLVAGRTPAWLIWAAVGFCLYGLVAAHPDARLALALGLALLIPPTLRLEADARLRVGVVGLFAGNASYAIYLVHVPVMRAAARALAGMNGIFLLLLLFAIGVAAGVAYHLAWERPALRSARRLWQAKRRKNSDGSAE